MKRKVQILMCGLLMICASFICVACGKLNFESDKIQVTNTTYAYDGNAHIFNVAYEGVDVEVTYSLDNETFVSGEELGVKEVGTYKIYYKLTAEKYNDYIGESNLVINKSNFDESKITVSNKTYTYDGQKHMFDVECEEEGVTITYSLNGETYGNKDTVMKEEAGNYKIYYKISKEGFNDCSGEATLEIAGVKIARNNSSYATINEAIENAEAEDTLVLFGNAVVDSTLNITKTINIDGQNKYAIKASDEFVGGNLISVATTTNTTLTLKDVTVDANSKARVIVVKNKNKLQILNANITGGYLANSYAPGVFITNEASFVMNGGSITGNKVADDYKDKDKYYVAYSLDLWIGANASGEGIEYQITKGTVGKMYINANSYSAKNPGKFTLTSGTIESIYLEYDSNYGAKLEFVNGTVGKLLVSTTTSGVYEEVTPVVGTTYEGGKDYTAA